LDRLVRGVPDEVVRMVKRATAKQAAQRYPSMREFADAIAAALDRFLAGARFEQTVMRDLVTHSDGPRGTTEPFSLSAEWSAEPPSAAAPVAPPAGSVQTEPLGRIREAPAAPSVTLARTATARALPAPEPARLFSPFMLLGAVLAGVVAAIPIGIWLGVDRPSRSAARSAASSPPPSAASRGPAASSSRAALESAGGAR
jgi:hypothetical protein